MKRVKILLYGATVLALSANFFFISQIPFCLRKFLIYKALCKYDAHVDINCPVNNFLQIP